MTGIKGAVSHLAFVLIINTVQSSSTKLASLRATNEFREDHIIYYINTHEAYTGLSHRKSKSEFITIEPRVPTAHGVIHDAMFSRTTAKTPLGKAPDRAYANFSRF